MATSRRHPHKPFDPALIESFLKGRPVESVSLFPQGRSNSNYKLIVDGIAYVLRLHLGDKAERERTVMRLADNVVPVPTILDGGDNWSIFSFVEGEHLSDRPDCLAAAAQVMTKIWAVPFERKGWIIADGSVEDFDFDNEENFGLSMIKNPEVQRWLEPPTLKTLEGLFQQDTPFHQGTGCLVHGDFNPSNILVNQGKVVAILDWEFSHSGEPFQDISNLIRHTPAKYHYEIRAGLESAGVTLQKDWLQRCAYCDLGSYLEFLTTKHSDDFKRQCADRIHEFVKKYEENA